MKKVFICSPFGGKTENLWIAKSMCSYAIKKGYAPIAPHLLYPQLLDDDKPEERELGIVAGLEWLKVCDEILVYTKHPQKGVENIIKESLTISKGMAVEIRLASSLGIPIDQITIKVT